MEKPADSKPNENEQKGHIPRNWQRAKMLALRSFSQMEEMKKDRAMNAGTKRANAAMTIRI